MRLAFVLVMTFGFWLVNCRGIEIKNSDQAFHTIWAPFIAFLNNDTGIKQPFFLAADLQKEFHEELSGLAQDWQKIKPSHLDKNAQRRHENEFFADTIKKRNDTLFSQKILEHTKNDYFELAKNIIQKVATNPVTSITTIYEHKYGDQIGFCFGRALLVHYLLLKAGVPQTKIFKIFSFGDLRIDHHFWHFHVAVLIVNEASGFLVVDPLYEKPLPVKEWMNTINTFDIKYPYPRTRFYLTDPRKFLPGPGFYDSHLLSQPSLRGYFSKLALVMRDFNLDSQK